MSDRGILCGLLVVPWLAVLVVPPTYGAEWVPVYAGLLLVAAAAHAITRHRRPPTHRRSWQTPAGGSCGRRMPPES